MKLTSQALHAIRDTAIRMRICQTLHIIDQTIMNYIRANKPNGPLTAFKVVQILREETGLSEKEILEEHTDKSQGKRTKSRLKRQFKSSLK